MWNLTAKLRSALLGEPAVAPSGTQRSLNRNIAIVGRLARGGSRALGIFSSKLELGTEGDHVAFNSLHTSSGMGRPSSVTMGVGRPCGLIQWLLASISRWRKTVAAMSWGRTAPLWIVPPRGSVLPTACP